MDPPECQGHSHDHDHTDDLGLSLRQYIDIPRVTCLNEVVAGSGHEILKYHQDRLSSTPSLLSPPDDPELLLTIPFTEAVTVQSICIRTATSSHSNTAAPRKIRLFTNREDLDFDMMHDNLPPQQTLELLPPDHLEGGTIDYPCRPAGRFQNISSLSLFVENNYNSNANDDDDDDDDDENGGTEITYIGLKGKGTKAKRMIVEAVYEAQGMPEDHKVPGDELANHNIM
jgi:hypothetical protein